MIHNWLSLSLNRQNRTGWYLFKEAFDEFKVVKNMFILLWYCQHQHNKHEVDETHSHSHSHAIKIEKNILYIKCYLHSTD